MTPKPRPAADLQTIAEHAAAERAAAEARQAAENERVAKAWEAAMSRAFKGIMPAPERRAQLRRAVERNDV